MVNLHILTNGGYKVGVCGVGLLDRLGAQVQEGPAGPSTEKGKGGNEVPLEWRYQEGGVSGKRA